MRILLSTAAAAVLALAAQPQQAMAQTPPPASAEAQDNLVWLEEVMGDKALNWVRTENERSLNVLQNDPRYAGLLE
ncbi:MAG: hypothetical protein ACK41P_10955, partial [Asticcacaulis sp.]